MQLYYKPDIISGIVYLNEEESAHCIRVLRNRIGSIINITNGLGTIFSAKITDENPKKCAVEILEVVQSTEKTYKIHIAIAPTKNISRFEWFLEKATELGIDEITPLVTKQSERVHINYERLNRLMVAAMKQSLNPWLPILNPLTDINKFLLQQNDSQKMIAWCENEKLISLKNVYKQGNHATIVIGPEGDFTSDEINTAKQSGYQPISLGNSRLRTETAGLYACMALKFTNE